MSGLSVFDSRNQVQDDVFAYLMDMFGDVLPTDVILNVGSTSRWKCKCNSYYFFFKEFGVLAQKSVTVCVHFFSLYCRLRYLHIHIHRLGTSNKNNKLNRNYISATVTM